MGQQRGLLCHRSAQLTTAIIAIAHLKGNNQCYCILLHFSCGYATIRAVFYIILRSNTSQHPERISYAEEYPDTVLVLTGGKGYGEDISEAECMRRYLVKHGVAESRLLLEDQLPTLIPFDRAVVFQTGRQNGQGTVAAPYTVGMPNDPKENPFLDRAVIPRWSQFIMAPHSTVFLQSDLIAAEDWIHSDIYRNIWEPCRLYWALGATIQYRDRPLALVALFRERDKADFNPKEFHILHTLKDALERKFYDLLAEPAAGVLPAERLRQVAAGYGGVHRSCGWHQAPAQPEWPWHCPAKGKLR